MDQRTSPFFSRFVRNLSAFGIGFALVIGAQVASADELVMRPDINQAKPGTKYYVHGLSMAQVAKKFGQPSKKLAPDPAKGTKYQPPITRWVYPEFTVYFEHGHAIHLVKHHQRPK
ncbi:MAG: hypothetical protein PHT38_03620 [Halothiobacillus sp.]|nr:hypothetical protein [Halothiobacillus sp.]